MRQILGSACLFFASAVLMVACGGGSRSEVPTSASIDSATFTFRNVQSRDVLFVGDDACFDCHETEWLGYQEHGMARSFAHVDSANLDVDLPSPVVVDRKSGLSYRVFRQGGGIFQEEVGPSPSAAGTHRLVRRVDYVIGSGTAARTFLTQLADRLYQLPLTWYTQTRRWDFSPGYDVANDRFNRLIPEGCLACHNDYPALVPFVTGSYRSLPDGIGCERCHGPGQLHVDERLAVSDPAGEYDDSIVNPAHLDLDRQLDVCQQCHLHATVSILRKDRRHFDYRPGETLESQVALFAVQGPHGPDEIAVISHAERLKRSACFVASAGIDEPMTCSTCHNPHEGFRDRGPDYFSRSCIGCHSVESLRDGVAGSGTEDEHTEASDCASCHMPAVEARDAPHASFTDHFIRVAGEEDRAEPPAVDSSVPDLEPVFPVDASGEEAQVYRGIAYITYGRQRADTSAFEQGIRILSQALRSDTTHTEARYLLGWAQYSMGRPAEAVAALEASVRAEPDIPERLNTLALALEATDGSPTVISRLYRRALTIQPELPRVRVNFGRFLQARREYEQAVDQYTRALDSEPTLEVAAFNLGTVALELEAPDEAEQWFTKALELNPLYADALTNLGVVYASRGETNRARGAFERAAEVEPDNRSALGNLGAFYVNHGAPQDAIPILRRAVLRDPGYVDALANLALAYFRVEDYASARAIAEQATRVDPENALARQVIIAVE